MENRDMNLFDFILLCCKAIGKFCKWVGAVVLQTIRLGLQYAWIVLPCVVLGVLGGWLWTKPFATTFKGNATIMYAEGMRDVVQEGLIDFLTLSKEAKMEYGVEEECLDDLSAFFVYNVIDCNADFVPDFVDKGRNVDLSDTLNVVMRDRVHLEVEMFGNRNFSSFKEGLLNFFSEQEYLAEAYFRCKKIQAEQLAYFTKEVARLDSFSTYDYFVRPRSLVMEKQYDNFIIGSKQNLYYDAVMVVLEHKTRLEMQSMSTPDVINFQTPFVVYEMPHIFKYIIGLFLGTLIGLLLALSIKYKANIVAYLKEK